MSAGTVYTEIDLDSTRWDAAQKRILYDSQTLCVNVENSWKNLGQKSDVIYDAMRQSATNAFERIKNDAKSSSDEIARAHEAMASKIKTANEQQFGSQTSLLDSLKSHWIAVSASIYAGWSLIQKGMDLVEMGAKVKSIQESFDIIAKSSGIATDALISNLRAATNETINSSELMRKANRMMIEGFSATQITQIGEAARIAARIMGTDVATAYDHVADAVVNLRERGLKTAGFVIDFTDAYKKHADAMGVGVTYLNEYGKQMAIVEALETRRLEMLKTMGPLEQQEYEGIQKRTAAWKVMWETIAKGALEAWGALNQLKSYFATKVGGNIPPWAWGGEEGPPMGFPTGEEHGVGAGRGPGTGGSASTKNQVDLSKMADDYRKMMEEVNLEITKARSLGAEDFDSKEKEVLATYEKNLEKWKYISGGFYAAEQIKNAQLGKVFQEEIEWVHKLDQELAVHSAVADQALKEGTAAGWGNEAPGLPQKGMVEIDGVLFKLKDLYKQLELVDEEYARETKEGIEFYDELEKGIAKYTEADRRRSEFTVQGTAKANEELMHLSGTYSDQCKLIDLETQALIAKYEYEHAATPDLIVLINKVADARKAALDPMNKFMLDTGNQFSSQMASMVSSVIQGTQTIGEAFKKMGQNMLNYFIDSLSKMAMNMALFGSMMSPTSMAGMFSGGGLFGFLGGLFKSSPASPYAWGGPEQGFASGGSFSVDKPTYFMAGESGREQVDITPAGKMGGRGGGQPMVINNNTTNNYNDFVDAQGIERIMPSVIRGMGSKKHADAMKNIIRRRG